MEKKIKLSDKQQEVLKKLQEGKFLYHIEGLNARCFFDVGKTIGWPTIIKLEDYGLVVRGTGYIRLTEAGKRWVPENKCKHDGGTTPGHHADQPSHCNLCGEDL